MPNPSPSKPKKRYEDMTPQERYDEDMKGIKLFIIFCMFAMLAAPVIVILGAKTIFGPFEKIDDPHRGPVQEHTFELLSYDPPKHVYVTLKDLDTNEIWQRIYVSKHCNDHRETMKPGTQYRLRFSDPTPESQVHDRKYEDLYEAICKGNQRIPS